MGILTERLGRCFRRMRASRRRAKGLKELELLDQAALNDLGMTRATLVGISYGKDAGRCAAY